MKQRNTLFASLPVTKVLARAFPKSQSLSNAGEIMDRQKFRKNRKYWSVQYLSWCYLISLVSLLNNFAATKLAQLPLVCKLIITKVICLFLKICHHWHQHQIKSRSSHFLGHGQPKLPPNLLPRENYTIGKKQPSLFRKFFAGQIPGTCRPPTSSIDTSVLKGIVHKTNLRLKLIFWDIMGCGRRGLETT